MSIDLARIEPGRLYEIHEAALLLGRTVKAVSGLFGRGSLPCVRARAGRGHARRVYGRALLDYLGATPPPEVGPTEAECQRRGAAAMERLRKAGVIQ